MHKRGLTTFLTLGGFLMMVLTGLVLYTTPQGWAANQLGWNFLGLNKHEWSDLHVIFSVLWVVAGLFHIYFNWRVLKAFAYSRLRGGWRLKKEMLLTLLLIGLVLAGTVYHVPPVTYITDLSERIKTSWISARMGDVSPEPGEETSVYGQGNGRGRWLTDEGAGFVDGGGWNVQPQTKTTRTAP